MLALGFFFSKQKQASENGKATSVKVLDSFHREVCGLQTGCGISHFFQSSTLLGDPFRTPQIMEPLVQSLFHGEQIADISSGVVKGLGGERAPPPVSSLEPLALRDSYPQQVFDDGCQPDPGQTGKAGSNVGIVQVADTKSAVPIEASDIVVRAMNDFDDRSMCQGFSEGTDLLKDDRVDDVYFVEGSNLNQAELLGIPVEAVGLGIKGDVSRVDHRLDGSVKLGGMVDYFDGKGQQDGHEPSIPSHSNPYNERSWFRIEFGRCIPYKRPVIRIRRRLINLPRDKADLPPKNDTIYNLVERGNKWPRKGTHRNKSLIS